MFVVCVCARARDLPKEFFFLSKEFFFWVLLCVCCVRERERARD